MCIWMGLRECMRACVQEYICACIGLWLTSVVFLSHSPPYILRQGLLFNPSLPSLTNWVAPEMPSWPPPCWDYRWSTKPTQLLQRCWDLNCGTYTCTTSTSLAKPSPQPWAAHLQKWCYWAISSLLGCQTWRVVSDQSATYIYSYPVSLGFPKLLCTL